MSRTSRLLPLVLIAISLVPSRPADGDAAYQSYQEIALDGPSAWEALHVEDDHGPDPSTPKGIERAGTDPLWVGDATGVQASAVTSGGTTVSGAKVILIHPGVLASDADSEASGEIGPAASRAPYPMPPMVSRKRWGADERLRSYNGAACARPKYTTTVQAAFVHHTADRNDSTRTQVPAMVRAMYTYHVKSRGWCDLGYNFLVDLSAVPSRAGSAVRSCRCSARTRARTTRTRSVSR